MQLNPSNSSSSSSFVPTCVLCGGMSASASPMMNSAGTLTRASRSSCAYSGSLGRNPAHCGSRQQTQSNYCQYDCMQRCTRGVGCCKCRQKQTPAGAAAMQQHICQTQLTMRALKAPSPALPHRATPRGVYTLVATNTAAADQAPTTEHVDKASQMHGAQLTTTQNLGSGTSKSCPCRCAVSSEARNSAVAVAPWLKPNMPSGRCCRRASHRAA